MIRYRENNSKGAFYCALAVLWCQTPNKLRGVSLHVCDVTNHIEPFSFPVWRNSVWEHNARARSVYRDVTDSYFNKDNQIVQKCRQYGKTSFMDLICVCVCIMQRFAVSSLNYTVQPKVSKYSTGAFKISRKSFFLLLIFSCVCFESVHVDNLSSVDYQVLPT